ncbi:MAG: alpha/beta hydrolase [Oscillospiraceae bacterium]|nr:alpha/beta hydrolase [Oscillospiraceae bacterium]
MSLCKKRLCWGLIIAGLLAFVVAVVLLVQPYLFFYPWHDETSCEALRQKDSFTELRIPRRGGELHGWLRKNSEEEKGPLLLFFGGNGQNASNTMQLLDGMHHFSYFENHHVLFVDYPGYGLSDGRPSESSLFAAALEVYDYASELDCVDRERISVLGYSIGTGVANYLATQRNIQGLILLAPYDRGLSLYNDALNIFHGPLKHLARFQFDSLSYAREIELAPLIVASRDDKVIPYPLALNLAEAFPHTPETVLLDQLSHDGFLYDSRVMEAIHSYLASR